MSISANEIRDSSREKERICIYECVYVCNLRSLEELLFRRQLLNSILIFSLDISIIICCIYQLNK